MRPDSARSRGFHAAVSAEGIRAYGKEFWDDFTATLPADDAALPGLMPSRPGPFGRGGGPEAGHGTAEGDGVVAVNPVRRAARRHGPRCAAAARVGCHD